MPLVGVLLMYGKGRGWDLYHYCSWAGLCVALFVRWMAVSILGLEEGLGI